jgi:hypothetical protein
MDDGWLVNSLDSVSRKGRIRHFLWGTWLTMSGNYSSNTDIHWEEWIRTDGIIDSILCSKSSSARDDVALNEYSLSTTTRVLLSVNGVQIRKPGTLAVVPSPRAKPSESFASLAARYPNAPIRWRDAQGRMGQFPANQLSRGGRASQLLFLEATFPDGSRWSVSYLSGVK